MSRTEKLLQRLLSIPKDLTWEELVKILAQFGYTELRKERRVVQEENSPMRKITSSFFINLIPVIL